MKILFICPYIPSRIRVRPYHFVRELGRHHDVTLLATDYPETFADADYLANSCERLELVPLRPRSMVLSAVMGALGGAPLQAMVCQSPALRHRLARVLSEDQFDVVHVEHLRAGALLEHLPPGLPSIYDAVDCISLLLERTLRSSHSLRQRLQARVELARTRRYEGQLLRGFQRTVVTSPDDAAALAALAGAPTPRPIVIPNGVDLSAFRPRADLERSRDMLVLSGKMSYHANVTAALHFIEDILPRVRAARPGAHLVIVGSNPPGELRRLAAESHGAVSVTGYVPDIADVLGRAAVAVCPVRVKVGIQNKVLEAMATGIPVVASRQGAEGLAAVPGRDFLRADDAEGFALHILRLLDDEALQQRIGAAGRAYVEAEHLWGSAAQRLVALYEEAITTRRGRDSTKS